MKLPPTLLRCKCNLAACKEKGKVCWEKTEGQYVHIRVDECVEYFRDLKKADCLILYFNCKGEGYAFIIEVKTKRYDLNDIKEKMENTISMLEDIQEYYNKRLVIIPIVYAKSHRIQWRRYAFLMKLRYRGGRALMAFLKYCENIQKAIPK